MHVPTTCDDNGEDDEDEDEEEDDVGPGSRLKSAIKTSRLVQPVLRARPGSLVSLETVRISASQ